MKLVRFIVWIDILVIWANVCEMQNQCENMCIINHFLNFSNYLNKNGEENQAEKKKTKQIIDVQFCKFDLTLLLYYIYD